MCEINAHQQKLHPKDSRFLLFSGANKPHMFSKPGENVEMSRFQIAKKKTLPRMSSTNIPETSLRERQNQQNSTISGGVSLNKKSADVRYVH